MCIRLSLEYYKAFKLSNMNSKAKVRNDLELLRDQIMKNKLLFNDWVKFSAQRKSTVLTKIMKENLIKNPLDSKVGSVCA